MLNNLNKGDIQVLIDNNQCINECLQKFFTILSIMTCFD